MLRRLGIALAALLAGLCAVLLYAWLRPNRAEVDPRLALEHWDVVSDGEHNSNTDMILWQGDFLLVHDARPYHLGTPDSRLVVRRSPDARRWETLSRLQVPGKDVRDPKLAVIGGRLFLYALPNSGTMATPEGTVLATSDDAVTWTPFEPVGPEGWLFWRPKSPDGGATWYVAAYWKEHGESILLRSSDGRSWQRVSTIHRGDGNDETAIEFLPDGRLLATARLEVTPDTVLGHPDAATAIAVAEPPYTEWRSARSQVTRLDGPALFRIDDLLFAVARHQPEPRGWPTRLGGVLSRKRTALYRVEPERLVHLTDLPSAGDTSYAGVVQRSGDLFVDYYTSRIDRDFPWLLGMFLPSEIRIARIPVESLLALSRARR
ncbi:MAG TPA: sialidase family protein [Myxococcota bacterium]|nr:sialidase family protein [Myxococcota bacterium]